MIALPNGHKIGFLCSSGALGFDGNGWWWEQPLRWFNYLRPAEFTIVTKTITYKPRNSGWLRIRPIKDGFVNAMGMPNPGLRNWIDFYYPKTKDYKVIVSIAPQNIQEAHNMATSLSFLAWEGRIIGVEYNASCPNVKQGDIVEIVDLFKGYLLLPMIVKLGYENCREMVRLLDGKADAFHLINSLKWKTIYPNKKSPFTYLGGGGVSGSVIKKYAEDALRETVPYIKTPIISGGGIDCVEDIAKRYVMGARAFSIGSLFLSKPWKPNQIVDECRDLMGEKYF